MEYHPLLAPYAGVMPASPTVPPGVPRLFLFGLSERSERTALSELRQIFLYTKLVGLDWPTPFNVVFIINLAIYLVCVKERSADSLNRVLAVISRLADAHPAFDSPRTASDARLLQRLRRFLLLRKPLAPRGRDAVPDPASFVPEMLKHLTDAPSDAAFRVRLLLLLNTGMRCCETSWATLLLSDIAAVHDEHDRLLYIRIAVRFSKTRKTVAEPLYKFLYPRADPLDAVRPLLRYLQQWHGVDIVAVQLAPGQQPRPVSSSETPLFPCAAPLAAPQYQASQDTAAVTRRIKRLAVLAGMPEEEAKYQGAHGCRSTFTTLLVQAGASVPFVEQVIGWNTKRHQSANRYLREAAARDCWFEANRLLAEFFARRERNARPPPALKAVAAPQPLRK